MDELVRFKPIMVSDMFKGVDKSYSARKTAYGTGSTDVEALTWYYVDRDETTWSNLTDDLKNLFHSFGVSREDQEDWFRVFNVNDWYNAKRMLVATIPQSACSSYIDGSTVRLNVPTGLTSGQFTTFYGATFDGYPDPVTGKQISMDYEDGAISYGGAYCYLFADTQGLHKLPTAAYPSGWAHPYTGTVNGAINPNSGATSFDPDNASLAWTAAEAKMSRHLSATHWTEGDTGKDIPYGVGLLEKGIFVVFDMYGRNDFIVESIMSATSTWTSTTANFSAVTTSGGANSSATNRKGVRFKGTAAHENAKLSYRTVDQSYKMIYFCFAGQNEFNSTSNHTYDQKRAYFRPEEADSLWVTEIGLYDENDDLLAYAKLSEPVEKNKLETLTFKVELQL